MKSKVQQSKQKIEKSAKQKNGSQKFVEKSKLVNQVSNLINKTQQPNIKMLNVDLFLKKEKEKRQQYIKNLNSEYADKKLERQKTLYQNNDKIIPEIKPKLTFQDITKLKKLPQQHQSAELQYSILNSHSFQKIKQFIQNIELDKIRSEENKLRPLEWDRAQRFVQSCDRISYDFDILKYEKLKIIPQRESTNLMNIFALIATKQELIQYMIVNRANLNITKNVFPFRFFVNQQKKTIFVDNFLEKIKLNHESIHKYSYWQDKNELCISIFEKAFRKLNQRTYSVMSMIEILRVLLNLELEVVKISKQAIINENFFKVLNLHVKNQSIVGFCRSGQIKGAKFLQGKIYVMRNIILRKQISSSTIQISNPWCDKKYNIVDLDDIIKNFNRILIIKDYPQKWSHLKFNSFFFSFGLPNSANTEWTKHNQHLLEISKKGYIKITMLKQQFYQSLYGYLLFKAQAGEQYITCMKMQKLIDNVKSNSINQATKLFWLKQGKYFLIPYSAEKSVDSYVFFSFMIGAPSQAAVVVKKTRSFQLTQSNKVEWREKYEATQISRFPDQDRLILDKLSEKEISDANLKIQNEGYGIEAFLYPGSLHNFLVYKGVYVKQSTSVSNVQDDRAQILYDQANQNLQILLGVDAFDQQVNKEIMTDAQAQLENYVDFANFDLEDQGFQRIITYVLEQPNIFSLDLTGNKLTDKSVTILCYYLEKCHHTEIKKINLSNNLITMQGVSSLRELKARMKSIQEINLDDNPGVSKKVITEFKNE